MDRYVYNDFEKDAGVIEKVIPKVFELEDRYRAAAQPEGDAEDAEVARGLCRIFTHMAESFLQLVCSQQEMGQLQVVNLVAMCIGHADVEIARITFRFWFSLANELGEQSRRPDKEERAAAFLQPLEQVRMH